MTIYTGTNASTEMKATLSRTVGVMDIADHANCKVLSVFRNDYCKLDADGGIEVLANIADFELNFLQATASKRPKLAIDTTTGRECAKFSDDATNNLKMDVKLPMNLNAAFSYLAVVKITNADLYQRIIGASDTTTDKNAVEYVQTKKLRFVRDTVIATETAPTALNTWYCAIASYNGAGSTTFEVIGGTPESKTMTFTKVNMDLMLGSTTAGLGFTGNLDMVAFFDKSVHADATLLADIKLMLKGFYGSALSGQ